MWHVMDPMYVCYFWQLDLPSNIHFSSTCHHSPTEKDKFVTRQEYNELKAKFDNLEALVHRFINPGPGPPPPIPTSSPAGPGSLHGGHASGPPPPRRPSIERWPSRISFQNRNVKERKILSYLRTSGDSRRRREHIAESC